MKIRFFEGSLMFQNNARLRWCRNRHPCNRDYQTEESDCLELVKHASCVWRIASAPVDYSVAYHDYLLPA